MNKIGILAYGSLINNPGVEIERLIIDRIICITPFKVEYARTSSKRSGAPTLIPTETLGQEVNATILVLKDTTKLKYAKSILWSRERHKVGENNNYVEIKEPSVNQVVVKTINDFENVTTVIYTSLGQNITGEINPEKLADLAIKSILDKAGTNKEDGIRYLLSAKENNIETKFSKEYENLLLRKTETHTLEEAIKKMDLKRNEN